VSIASITCHHNYYNNLDGAPWLPHEGEAAPLSVLEEVGVYATNFESHEEVELLVKENGYNNMDEVLHSLMPH